MPQNFQTMVIHLPETEAVRIGPGLLPPFIPALRKLPCDGDLDHLAGCSFYQFLLHFLFIRIRRDRRIGPGILIQKVSTRCLFLQIVQVF